MLIKLIKIHKSYIINKDENIIFIEKKRKRKNMNQNKEDINIRNSKY